MSLSCSILILYFSKATLRLFKIYNIAAAFTERNISFKIAETIQDFADGKELFQQYANSLDFDLGFQGFADELIKIDSQYNKPKGSVAISL